MADMIIYANPNPASRGAVPYLVDVQSSLLSSLNTRVVVPLYPKGTGEVLPFSRLTPEVVFQGTTYIAMVPELAGVPRRQLGVQAGQLDASRNDLLAALDLLFIGF
jgi:toxin CcdB